MIENNSKKRALRPLGGLPESLAAIGRQKWEECLASLEKSGGSPPSDLDVIDSLKLGFSFSEFIAKNCIHHPQMLSDLIQTGDAVRSYSSSEYGRKAGDYLDSAAYEDSLMRLLRQFRRREMTRIAFRDLSGRADLWETLKDLSSFADACIQAALSRLYAWHCARFGVPAGTDGSPQELVVLGMGKLGARELNFSSDVDLIFACAGAGTTQGGPRPLTHDEFFSHLCRRLIHVLAVNTIDGFVFRVDMNLRPYGESGPLVMSFDALESYYHDQGREWERYAWIKARPIAGDMAGAGRLLARLRPFIYRRYLDYGVFDSLREMKQKIALEIRRHGMEDHIKLGRGGIREVEFFGQIFQLIRGGLIPELQEPRIRRVLDILAQDGYIRPHAREELVRAYEFLRNTEHRLQEFADAQTHTLPQDEAGRERLALSMGFQNWEDFAADLEEHRRIVHGHFNRLLKQDDEKEDPQPEIFLNSLWANPVSTDGNLNLLKAAGYEDPGAILNRLSDLKNDLKGRALSSEGRERIDRLMPLVVDAAGGADRPDISLERILNLIKAIRRRTSYVSLLLENPQALGHLVRLADTSAWILNFLCSHPLLLDELLDPRTLYMPPERDVLEAELKRRMSRVASDDLELQMDALRAFRQVNVLRVAAADITNTIPLMRVSDYLSDIAETILNQVIDRAWAYLVERHGFPPCSPGLETCDRGFAIIAYGKLGGLELGYGSDLDLVFIHSGVTGMSSGEKPIDATTFFARLGQRVLHILSTHTATGRLYETDMRLRPSGDSGVLVSHVEGFRDYQLNQAWTWEKQAIVRARPIAGDPMLMSRFSQIRRESLAQPRDPEKLKNEIRDMRARMRGELLKPDPDVFDLKQGDGGIVDIEFLVQYLTLLNAHKHPEILEWTDNVRLIHSLAEARIIDEITAYFLRKAYLIYRATGHKLSLRELPSKVETGRFQGLRTQVKAAWDRYITNSL
jgi:glutamate-ammonia-ligase adenylyltransferase